MRLHARPVLATVLLATATVAQQLDFLPVIDTPPMTTAATDWLVDRRPFVARLGRDAAGEALILDNGLVRRTWCITPDVACVAFDDLMRGEALLRAVRPEARVTIDGVERDVGGLTGQPDHAFLAPEWLAAMRPSPDAFRFTGWASGPIEPRLAWARVRHAAPDATWPPKGVHLRLDFALPPPTDARVVAFLETPTAHGSGDEETPGPAPDSGLGRERLLHSDFATLDGWRRHVSPADARSSVENEGKPGEIMTPANTAAFVERDLPAGTHVVEVTLDVGTDRSASWGPGIALDFADRTVKLNLRPGGNEYDATMMLGAWDGAHENPRLGGRVKLDVAQPWTLRLRITDGAILCDARPANGAWQNHGVLAVPSGLGDPRVVRIGKLDQTGHGRDFATPGELVRAHLLEFAAYGPVDVAGLAALRTRLAAQSSVRVAVHYELYDGVPLFAKWLEVHNDGDATITVDRFQSEILAVVEESNFVETRDGVLSPRPEHLHVETDFAFGGFNFENANRHVVHWRTDPEYTTQVNYLRQTPCLCVVEPTYGPAQAVAPGGTFVSFRTFELAHDSWDRERRGLGLRRMYRTIAPWVTENPLMMHMRDAAPDKVRAAIDQCADVGFEMLILSFGSGFDIENTDPAYVGRWREIADDARSRGIEIGGYSLLSSRSIGGGNDVVSPPGERPTHGNCPALTSDWGQRYFAKLYAFFPATGFRLLEHDGSYPGDVDITPRPPLQKGIDDSRWVQWRTIADFYGWCRGEGIYLNVPDYYYLSGSNKCGMGYREVNWSLPRALQVIHTRQNIHDGTWRKTPSMGWMFVPLTEYHGGGAAATIEPLDEHLDHYDRMLTSNLAFGVQACYRGPRLYDTPRTRDLVARRVAWFKRYRDILESDVVHGRRADGRDVDWALHVNPELDERGLLVAFNPLDVPLQRTLRVDLHYTGLRDRASVAVEDVGAHAVALDADGKLALELTVPAGGFTWVVFRAP